jgi:hypothetical protein
MSVTKVGERREENFNIMEEKREEIVTTQSWEERGQTADYHHRGREVSRVSSSWENGGG